MHKYLHLPNWGSHQFLLNKPFGWEIPPSLPACNAMILNSKTHRGESIRLIPFGEKCQSDQLISEDDVRMCFAAGERGPIVKSRTAAPP